MFSLHMEGPQGPFRLRFDPLASRITDDAGMPVDLAPLGLAYGGAASFKTAGAVKDPHVRHLRIQLGLGCNFRCTYCSQADSRDGHGKSGDVGEFLAGLDGWLGGEPDVIEFWGGEPFVYWRTLRPLAEGLRQRFANTGFKITSNGSLLDTAKVDWLDALGFTVAVSHDGPGQHQRGPDPLDDPDTLSAIRRLFSRLGPRVSFHPVLTLPHHSPKELISFFADKMGGVCQVSSEGLVTAHHADAASLSPRTAEEHAMVRRRLFDEFRMPEVFTQSLVMFPLLQLAHQLATGLPGDARGQACGMDRPQHLAVTLGGDVLACNNVSVRTHRMGGVDDIKAILAAPAKVWRQRPECQVCPALLSCGGACMLLEGPERVQSCENGFTLGMVYLATLLYVLTGAELVRIEGGRLRFPGITSFEF